MIRVADYIFKRIAMEGVDHIFYVPGGQSVYFCDALRRSEELSSISCHHEQAAAMAAVGYAKYNNNFGACLVTTGCAGTNTLTAILHAWQDSTPMIVISGQQGYSQTVKASGLPLRQVGVQEADTETIVKPITKFAVTVEDAKMIVYYMDKAIYLAKHGRKGPVWIDVPLNVQNSMIDEDVLERFNSDECLPKYKDEDLSYVTEMLKSAKRPVILAGNGIRTAGAVEEFKLFCKKNSIPVVFSRFAYDILDYDDPNNFGIVSGVAGAHRYANFVVQNSDFVLCIGTRLAIDTVGSDFEKFARAAKIAVVDIDRIEHSKKGVIIDRFIESDAKVFIAALGEVAIGEYSDWFTKCSHWKDIFPSYDYEVSEEGLLNSKYVMSEIAKASPAKTVYVSDAGFTGAMAPSTAHIKDGQRIIYSFAQGEMGFALPGAYGVSTEVSAPVIAYTGDGSIMMNLQELQTLKRNNFNVKVVIINNNGYSGVRHGQKAHFRGKSIGVDPETGVDFPDFGKLSEAFGLSYYFVESKEFLAEGIKKMFETDGSFILEVKADPNQIDLHNGLVMYGNRKFGFRPIEDQAPYIDRELFFKEMVIDPLEESSGKPM